jgi:Na+-driven multidrug efflux pump
LGARDAPNARGVLRRVLFLGFAVSSAVGAAVWLLQGPVLAFFTSDAAVIREALLTLPMLCLMFPLDAAASAMDGGLLAAQQTGWLSGIQIAGAVGQYGVLVYLSSSGLVTVLTIWACLKLLTVARAAGGFYVNFLSPDSAYMGRGIAAKA